MLSFLSLTWKQRLTTVTFGFTCWFFTNHKISQWQQNHAYETRSDMHKHYNDVIMGTIASQITSLTIVYSTVYSDADQTKYESSASLAFVQGIHRGPVNSPHKWRVTRKMLPFDDVFMICEKSSRCTCRYIISISTKQQNNSEPMHCNPWLQYLLWMYVLT